MIELRDQEEADTEKGTMEDVTFTKREPFADSGLEQSFEDDERERTKRFRTRLMLIGAGVGLFIGEFICYK